MALPLKCLYRRNIIPLILVRGATRHLPQIQRSKIPMVPRE